MNTDESYWIRLDGSAFIRVHLWFQVFYDRGAINCVSRSFTAGHSLSMML